MQDEELHAQLQRENLKLSSFNKRAIAFLIDDMIISLIFAVIFWDRFQSIRQPEALVLFVNSLFIYIITVKTLYQTIFVALYGQTLGKMAVKITVINKEYFDKPNILEAFQRALIRALSEIVFYIGFLWANFNPLRQTWHDKFAKTLVVDV